MNLTWVSAATGNQAIPPRARLIRAVVLHDVEGYATGAIAWFSNPQSGVSAHYVVAKDGQVTQMVKDEYVAFHVARADRWVPSWLKAVVPQGQWSAVNECTLGIEIEGFSPGPYTEEQYQAVAELLKAIHDQWQVTLDWEHIVYHAELQKDRSDPEPHDRQIVKQAIWKYLDGKVDMDVNQGEQDLVAAVRGLWPGQNAYEQFQGVIGANAEMSEHQIPALRSEIATLKTMLENTKLDLHSTSALVTAMLARLAGGVG